MMLTNNQLYRSDCYSSSVSSGSKPRKPWGNSAEKGVWWQILAAVGSAAKFQTDVQSQQTAVATLQAVCPAWIAAGKTPEELVCAAVHASMDLPVHRALVIVTAIVSVLPEVRTAAVAKAAHTGCQAD